MPIDAVRPGHGGDCLEAPQPAERLVARLAPLLEGASPLEVLETALDRDLCGPVALVSSFGTDSAVLLHMAAMVDPAVPVLFLDTGFMFEETLAYRDTLAERLGLTDIRVLVPDAAEQAAEDPDRELWMTAPDACCALRKVRPLARGLAGFSGWINGRKWFQAATRAGIGPVERDGDRVKFNPLHDMGPQEIRAWFERYDLPRHPLAAKGFTSIGCMPCTSRTRPGEDARAGRWRGRGKLECGIHGS